MAIISLVFGVVSCIIPLVPFYLLFPSQLLQLTQLIALAINLIPGILGIILGANALKKTEGKGGIAKGGLITSIIGVAISVIFGMACATCVACTTETGKTDVYANEAFTGEDGNKYTITGVDFVNNGGIPDFVFTIDGISNENYTFLNGDAIVNGKNGDLEKVNPSEIKGFFENSQTMYANNKATFYLICKGTKETGVYTLEYQGKKFEFNVLDNGKSLVYNKKQGEEIVEAKAGNISRERLISNITERALDSDGIKKKFQDESDEMNKYK